MKKSIAYYIVLLLVAQLLSGCGLIRLLLGNGEGYPGGKPQPPTPSLNEPSPPPPPSNVRPVIYNWYQPGNFCESDPDRTSIRKKQIVVEGDKFYVRGDECSGTAILDEGSVEDLEEFDGIIGFEEGIYQRQE